MECPSNVGPTPCIQPIQSNGCTASSSGYPATGVATSEYAEGAVSHSETPRNVMPDSTPIRRPRSTLTPLLLSESYLPEIPSEDALCPNRESQTGFLDQLQLNVCRIPFMEQELRPYGRTSSKANTGGPQEGY